MEGEISDKRYSYTGLWFALMLVKASFDVVQHSNTILICRIR